VRGGKNSQLIIFDVIEFSNFKKLTKKNMLKIASWNVNSLRVRLPQVLDWLKTNQPDILALQEIKMTNEQFPLQEIEAAGYHALFSGQKTYNGVALLSRMKASEVISDLPNLNDPQRRILAATYYDKLRVVNVYVPNGAIVDSDKYYYKLNWLKHLHNYLRQCDYTQLIVLGDFNIAPDDRDVNNPPAWEGEVLVSQPERAALHDLLALGLRDTFRLFEQPANIFSCWDYRAGAFRRNHGSRIDLILASTTLNCSSSVIDINPRRLVRPSDHTPVVARFNLK
jgi:exodeoxyribonuclease-3